MSKRLAYHVMVTVGLVSYIISINSPLITVKKFLFINDTVSLFQILSTLLENEEIFLGSIIFIFTIILPILKFSLLIAYGLRPSIEKQFFRSYKYLEHISRWAMLDVFIAALVSLG